MKVILREDMKSLGKMGEVVKVTPGYARNYLIPKGLAVEAVTKNIRALEHEKRVIQDRARKILDKAKGLAGELSAVSLTIKARAGEEEKLFGSVTAMDIAEALKEKGFAVDKKKILLDEPIKRLGAYRVDVRVAPDVAATVSVEVVAE